MKKIFLAMLFMVPSAFLAAQGIGIGIKAGANFANMEIDEVDTKSVTSFHVGAYLNLNLSEKFGITPEVLWTSQGSEVEDFGDFETDWVSVPIMLRYKILPPLFIEAGPQFNFLLNAEYGGDDVKDQLKGNDFGLGLGAGVMLPLGFNGGVRYVLGFTNINDVSEESIKNRVWQIYVGWTLFGAK